ncbi:MAG: hypothetical protein ACHQ6T_08380 [Myxococcota bacterium]
MLRLGYLAGVLALAVFYYFFFGAGPTPSEYVEDLQWWRPWGTVMHAPALMGLAKMARAGFPDAWVPILLGWLPPVALSIAGWRVLRSALARSILIFLALLMLAFVYYGMRAEQVWRFFEWRFIAVAASFAAIVVLLLFAASLVDETLRRSRALALVVSLSAIAGIFVLSTEVTGTNSEMQFNISPWPIVTLFGFLLAGATIAALHAAAGAAVFIRSRIAGAAGALAALSASAVVAGAASAWIFSAPRARVPVVALAVLISWLRMRGAARTPDSAARAGLVRFATGAVLLIAILGSAQAGAFMQRRARDVTALVVLDALEAYKKDNATYPDRLDALVPKYLAEIPRPQIGLIRDEDDRFSYSNYGDSYALEFASVLWVQCQYSPPYEFAAADPNEEAADEAEAANAPGAADADSDTPDVSAQKEPTAEDLALKATLAKHGLNGSWSCPKDPPKLW